MYFISVTRLKLSSIRFLPGFMSANKSSVKQLQTTPGFLGGMELLDKGFLFWTMTLWEKGTDMKNFRNSPVHRKAMQNLPVWCSEATFAHWSQEAPTLPSWDIVHQRIINEGVVSKVRNASEYHLPKSFPSVKWFRLVRKLTPSLTVVL